MTSPTSRTGPCQHPRLTWDILYRKGFCLDCDAKIRAWHGEWSDFTASSETKTIDEEAT